MDRIDDAYNGLMGEDFMRKTRERLHWICSKVNGENVMDVGCSQGTLARLLASLGKSVLGIDINKEAISYAEARLGETEATSRERVQFVAVNFMDYKTTNRFDTVVMGEILEHLPAPEAFVKKAWTHLSPGGTLVVTVPFGINDDPDHRQTFYWSWMRELIAPLFDIVNIELFGKWIGVVGTKRDRKAPVEKSISLSAVKELEKAFYAIERPLVNDVKAHGLKMRAQQKDIDETRKNLAAKTAEAKTAMATGNEQKARADKAVADYTKLKADLTAEIATQKDAVAKAVAAKNASDAAAAKQKTVLEGEIARQKAALVAEQAKTKDFNAKLNAARNELAAVKNEALEAKVNLEAERKISGGQSEQITVLKAALQLAANRPQIDTNETRLLEYSQEVRELRTALEVKRDEAVSRAEQMGLLSGELQALKVERDYLSQKMSELSSERDSRMAELEESRTYARLCEEENAKLGSRNKELAERLETASLEKTGIEERLSALEDENASKDEAISRIAHARTELERESALLKGDVRDLRTAYEELRRNLAAAESSGESLQEEIDAVKQEKEKLSILLERARPENAQLRHAAEEAKSDLAKAKTQHGDLSLQLDAARQALDGLRKERDAESSECVALQSECGGLKNTNAVLSAKFNTAQNELAVAKSALVSERQTVQKVQDEMRALEAASKKAAEVQQKTIAAQKKEIAALSGKLNSTQSELAVVRSSLSNEKQAVKKVQDEKRALEAAGKKAADALQKTIDAQKKEIDTWKKEVAAKSSEIEACHRRAAESQKSFADLCTKYEELKVAKTKAVLLYNEKAAKMKELSVKYKSLANSKLGRLTLKWWEVKDGLLGNKKVVVQDVSSPKSKVKKSSLPEESWEQQRENERIYFSK